SPWGHVLAAVAAVAARARQEGKIPARRPARRGREREGRQPGGPRGERPGGNRSAAGRPAGGRAPRVAGGGGGWSVRWCVAQAGGRTGRRQRPPGPAWATTSASPAGAIATSVGATGMPGMNTRCTPLTITRSSGDRPARTTRSPSSITRPSSTSRRCAVSSSPSTQTYLRSWSVSTALSSTSSARVCCAPASWTRANRPGGVAQHRARTGRAGGRSDLVVDEVERARVRPPVLAGQARAHHAAVSVAAGAGVAAVAQPGLFVGFEVHVHRILRDHGGEHGG